MSSFPITGTTNNPNPVGTMIGPDGKISKKTDNSAMDKDSFLKLMVAQLKYQSPDSPMDSSKFMEQSAQFTMLEALQNMQKDQTSMLLAQRSTEATSMLGQKITAASTISGAADITGVVTGVRLGTDGPVLKVGDKEVPLSNVKEVSKS